MFSWDDFLSSASSVIDSIGNGLESLVDSVGGIFDFDLGEFFNSDADPSSVFESTVQRAGEAVGGIDDSDFDVGKSVAAMTKDAGGSVLQNGLKFVKDNPELTKIGAGLIGGAMKGYQTEKALEQQDKQFRDRLEAEKQMLRDKYKYDTESQMEMRRQKQQNAYGTFMGAN
jgi:hypothetical protein